MVSFVCGDRFSGIRLTQVGDPLADGQESFVHGISSDRLAGLAILAEPDAEDEEIAELVFLATDITEGRGDVVLRAEEFPESEDGVFACTSRCNCRGLGNSQRNAEIRREASPDGRWSSFQGSRCG